MTDENQNGNGKAEPEAKKPTCFVVSPIGAVGSPERKHANVTLKFIIEPVLERCGFQKALRADTLGESGIISRQIISQLLNADLVIADLTFHNPNVYYELAIRHGTGKPFVQLLTRGQSLPFDVAQQRTIFFDRTDLEDVEDCKAELSKQVTAAMALTGPMETPIGQTLDYEKLRMGGPLEQALAKLTDQVSTLNREPQTTSPTRREILRALGNVEAGSKWSASLTDEAMLQLMVKDRTQAIWRAKGFTRPVPAAVLAEVHTVASLRAATLSGLRGAAEIDEIATSVIDGSPMDLRTD